MFKFFRKNQKKPEDQPVVDAGLSSTRAQLDNSLSDAISQAGLETPKPKKKSRVSYSKSGKRR